MQIHPRLVSLYRMSRFVNGLLPIVVFALLWFLLIKRLLKDFERMPCVLTGQFA